MDPNLRSIHDALHALRDELAMTRVIAQLLLRRLDHEPDDQRSKQVACQVIIEQTRLIERTLDQVDVGSTPAEAWLIVDREFAALHEYMAHGA